MFRKLFQFVLRFQKKENLTSWETTQEFKNFVKYYAVNDQDFLYESEGNRLCRYMLMTTKSPYIDDTSFEKSKATLRRNGISDKFLF